jgi:rubrerythrin
VEGYNDVDAMFRSTAEGETGHAPGHPAYPAAVGDPATGLPLGSTGDSLKAAATGAWSLPGNEAGSLYKD